MKRFLPRLSYANVVSSICLFLLLGGGAALAAGKLGKNTVGSRQLKAGAVTSAKVKDGSLTSTDIQAGTIPAPVNAYTKPESDGRYLRGTITVVGSIPAVAANSFESGIVNCPAGYQAVGGGVDPYNIFFGKVSESTPTYNGIRGLSQNLGQQGPANGWYGAISTEGAGTGSTQPSKVIVICSPIG